MSKININKFLNSFVKDINVSHLDITNKGVIILATFCFYAVFLIPICCILLYIAK